jgi:phospholipid transport system substrate-binding protein
MAGDEFLLDLSRPIGMMRAMNKSAIQFLRTLLISLCCIGLVSVFPQVLKADTRAPVEALETFLATVRSMEFPIKNEARHSELAAQANAFLDLESMGIESLGAYWDQATSEEQAQFFDLLWQLIEQMAYAGGHKFLGTYKITYPEVNEREIGFDVHSIVAQEEEAFNATVVYHLYQEGVQWKIDDIVLDDVSMIEDLSYQFDKLIQGSSFQGLLDRMQEKLTEVQKKNKGEA